MSINPKACVGLYSFSKKVTNPKTQFEFDVSLFRDPQGQAQFRTRNGTDSEVQKWLLQDDRAKAVIQNCRIIVADLLGVHAPSTESRSNWVSFSFLDYHGKWIAPAIAELVAAALMEDGWTVTTHHLALRGK